MNRISVILRRVLMDINFNDKLDPIVDSLEATVSDHTRKLGRQIKIEWQRVVKYKNDLAAKEDELLAAKERIKHQIETKKQNENYLNSTQKRLQNLKLSNDQMKNKLNHLNREKEKTVKNCNEQEEYMRKSIELYKEKWRQRYEERYSKDPKFQERQRITTEFDTLTEELRALNEEQKKYEKELFQAKSERNKRHTEENNLYPFNNFVVSIAKIYVETKKVYGECEIVSKEIADIEKKIKNCKSKHEMLIPNNIPLNSNNSKGGNFGQGTVDEINTSDFPKQMSMEVDSVDESSIIKRNSLKSVNLESNITDKMSDTMQNMKSLQNEWNNSNNTSNKILFSDNVGGNLNTAEMKENLTAKTAKVAKEPKVKKWMERLKIFIPKFSSITEETDKNDPKEIEKVSKADFSLDKEKEKQDEVLQVEKLTNASCDKGIKNDELMEEVDTPRLKSKEKRVEISNKQEILAPVTKKVSFQCTNNSALQLDSIKNTSKYFRKDDSDIPVVNLYKITPNESSEVVRSVIQGSMEQIVQDAINMEEIAENKKDFHHETSRLNEAMDVEEHSKRNNEFDFSNQKVKEIAEVNVQNENTCTLYGSNNNKQTTKSPLKLVETDASLSISNKKGYMIENQIHMANMEVDVLPKVQDELQDAKNENIRAVTSEIVSENVATEPPEKQSYRTQDLTTPHMPMDIEIKEPEKMIDDSVSNKANTSTEVRPNCQKVDPFQKSATSINSSAVAPTSTSYSPVVPTSKAADSIAKLPSPAVSNPKTPTTGQLQNSAEVQARSSDSSLPIKSIESPGFAYTSRLMYQPIPSTSASDPPQNIPLNVQNTFFAQMAFINNASNINFGQTQSPDEDKSEFLASAYENYLTDSPPMVKGTEKNMFAYVEDSPEKEGKDDFFPLFASDNGESGKDTKPGGTLFTFNFGNSNQPQSPEENRGFKFLF